VSLPAFTAFIVQRWQTLEVWREGEQSRLALNQGKQIFAMLQRVILLMQTKNSGVCSM